MTTFLLPLPDDAHAFAELTWTEAGAWYDRLEALSPDPDPERWLRTWSHFESLLHEAASRAMIAYTCSTTDREAEAAHRRFSIEILPRAEERGVRLARRAVAARLEDPALEQPLARFQATIKIFREENVPLLAELEELSTQYQGITGGMLAEWEGDRIPIPRLAPVLEDRDRSRREAAWRASIEPYRHAAGELHDLFDRMRDRRQRVARNAGFSSYRDYVFPAKARYDYTPADCEAFHEAVAETVVPVVQRLREVRRERLGVPTLRPWDLAVSPWRTEPIRPWTDPEDFPRIASRIFDRLDPVLGAQFHRMREEGLLDLESRPGKAPGGYCDTLHVRGQPFIFMNAAGVMGDVMTLLHEAGHAFHAFAAAHQPLLWQRQPGAESAELASMSMELLASRYLGPPEGYLTEEEARVARMEHLEGAVLALAHIASVDAFQHWLYTDPAAGDAAERDRRWSVLRDRFDPGIDWNGLEDARATRWHRQLHIFLYPFYYIEYGFAQIGALQVWQNSLSDPRAALEQYRSFLTLGATRPLPDLYRAAGASFVFDRTTLARLMAEVEALLDRWREGIVGD